MADLSALGQLNPVEVLDLENYAENRAPKFQLPVRGEYTLRAPESFPPAAFGRTKAGSLSITVDPTIVGPTNEGFQLRYTKISAKPFKRDNVTVSQVGDYLKAFGFKGILRNEQEQADAVEATAGQLYRAELDWRAYNSRTGFQLEGMTRFPKLSDGTHQPWVADPTEKDENGQPVRLRANIIVSRFIPADQA